MIKILLVCNAGMSTSILVQKMDAECKARGIEAHIEAKPILVAMKEVDEWDVVMVGPQVRHQLAKLKKSSKENTPIALIEMRDYGMMNGPKILDAALALLEDK